MASMFDQYHNTLKREDVNPIPNNLTSSGFVSVPVKDGPSLFTKSKIDLNLPYDITHLTVCNGWLMLLMSNNNILRMNLLEQTKDEVTLDKSVIGLKVTNLFLDPLGVHLLIACSPKTLGVSAELFYLHRKSSKPRKVHKFKDHEITAVGFNFDNQSENSTGSILLGTNKGLIFESELSVEGEKFFQNNWKQLPNYLPLYGNREILDGLVFDIGRGEDCPISGIEFHRAPNTLQYFIIVTTLDRLYKFRENLKPDDKPLLQNVFNAYLNVPEHFKDFQEIPSKLKYSKLRLCYDKLSKEPKCFGWLTEPGIFYGEIDSRADTPVFIISNEIIPYPLHADNVTVKSNKTHNAPLSFALSDFHALLLYSDHVTSVSLLNYQTVYEEYFVEHLGKMLEIIKDTTKGMIYCYSAKCIFRFNITNEDRNVWWMYADKNDFELAKKYSQNNPAHMDIVLVKEAEMHFNQKRFIDSAATYAQTQSSFEAVCLKFIEIKDNDALMTYLKHRLEKLGTQDKTQITMLVVWMVELYLTEMARFADNVQRVHQLQKEFDRFTNIPRVVDCMRINRSVIYELIASHGDNHNLTMLTTVNKDFDSVVNQHINLNKFSDALDVLKSQKKVELYYKYCPILMEEIPKDTIVAIIALGKKVDIIKLLPTLVCLESPNQVTEVVKYLEFCIYSSGCTDQSIHNFLIKLYGKYQQEKMMTYLENQGKDISMVYYDVHYALRVCREHSVSEACVFLQCLLEMWHPAVELALKFNTKLAQQTASQPTDRELRRKLWLKIAEHEIKGKDDVTEALDLLRECDLLRIEDLLPFFSEFQKIDHFKEAICDALKDYNMKIQEQRKDMEESAKSAERVRNDLQAFRNRSVIVNGQEQCAICSVYLLLKPFFIFPCGHKFHGDCLEKDLVPLLSTELSRKLSLLKIKLSSMTTQQDNISVQGTGISSRDQVKLEIENIVASDCLFCGEYMINSIDQPFIEDWDKVNSDWD